MSISRFRALLLIVLIGWVWSGTARAALLGDVNGDGQVTVADAIALLQYIVGEKYLSQSQLILGDVYPNPGTGGQQIGDGRIDIQDVIRLLSYTVGLISKQDFGANDQYIALYPTQGIVATLDQIQFTAVPINFDGTVTWSLQGTGTNTNLGTLSTTGLYVAPPSLTDDFTVNVLATVGTQSVSAPVSVTNIGSPPPPP